MSVSVCTFFGHSECPENMKNAVLETVENLIRENDVKEFLVGDKGRFDRIVLDVLRDVKRKHPDVCYSVVLSSLQDKADLDYTETVFPEGIEVSPPRFAISWRNRWMVKQADCVVAYVCHTWGGAAKFVEYAIRQKKKVINLGSMHFE